MELNYTKDDKNYHKGMFSFGVVYKDKLFRFNEYYTILEKDVSVHGGGYSFKTDGKRSLGQLRNCEVAKEKKYKNVKLKNGYEYIFLNPNYKKYKRCLASCNPFYFVLDGEKHLIPNHATPNWVGNFKIGDRIVRSDGKRSLEVLDREQNGNRKNS